MGSIKRFFYMLKDMQITTISDMIVLIIIIIL